MVSLAIINWIKKESSSITIFFLKFNNLAVEVDFVSLFLEQLYEEYESKI